MIQTLTHPFLFDLTAGTATSVTGSDDQRSSGASPVLIVESLPPYNTAGPVVAVATTGPVIAIAYRKVIRMVRIANKGFEITTQSCVIDAPILGTGFEITPTDHTITSISFDKKNPSLILAKLNNGDVAIFDTRTKFRGKGTIMLHFFALFVSCFSATASFYQRYQ